MTRFIHLGMPNDPFVLDEAQLRAAIVANAAFACNGGEGRIHGDPVFDEVVEDRQRFPRYSGCADLVHWCLRRCGFRNERILNRDDDGGKKPWRSGVNVSRLVYAAGSAFSWWKRGALLNVIPGDMALLGDPGREHVCIVAEVTEQLVTSYDYGQVLGGKPAGRKVTRHVVRDGRGRWSWYETTWPGKPFMERLDPCALLSGPLSRGELLPAEVPDGFVGGSDAGGAPANGSLDAPDAVSLPVV